MRPDVTGTRPGLGSLRNATFVFVMLLINLQYISLRGQALQDGYKLLRFGVKGFGGVTDTSYVNTIANNWLTKVADASNVQLEGLQYVLPVNVEYGFQPFIILQPFHFLQAGMKMDYAFSGMRSEFKNPWLDINYSLNIQMKSCIPAFFTYINLGRCEIGASLLKAYTMIRVNDEFFGYRDSWTGNNTGYEFSLGYSSSKELTWGFTMAIRYRDLVIDKFTDRFNRTVIQADSGSNMSLKMSGFFIDMGIYYQLFNIKKKRK